MDISPARRDPDSLERHAAVAGSGGAADFERHVDASDDALFDTLGRAETEPFNLDTMLLNDPPTEEAHPGAPLDSTLFERQGSAEGPLFPTIETRLSEDASAAGGRRLLGLPPEGLGTDSDVGSQSADGSPPDSPITAIYGGGSRSSSPETVIHVGEDHPAEQPQRRPALNSMPVEVYSQIMQHVVSDEDRSKAHEAIAALRGASHYNNDVIAELPTELRNMISALRRNPHLNRFEAAIADFRARMHPIASAQANGIEPWQRDHLCQMAVGLYRSQGMPIPQAIRASGMMNQTDINDLLELAADQAFSRGDSAPDIVRSLGLTADQPFVSRLLERGARRDGTSPNLA